MGESPRESGGLGVEGTKSNGVRTLDVARVEVEGRVGRATREARDEGGWVSVPRGQAKWGKDK